MRLLQKIVTVSLLVLSEGKAEETGFLLCGAKTVWRYPPEIEARTWRWQASDSPEIPEAAHPLFRSTDDCKPIGKYVLITSSSGGVALINRQDRRCAFYTQARNAHSACLLPGMRVAVAASTGKDAVLIFDRRRSGLEAKPLYDMPLVGAHGVTWDGATETLWALGTDVLLKFDREMKEVHRITLPSKGGHDLSPAHRRPILFITTNTAVYEMNTRTHVFTPHPVLGAAAKVKSVDEHPQHGGVVFQQAVPDHWWGHHLRFASDQPAIPFPDEILYKIRWDVAQPTPQEQVVKKLQVLGATVFRNDKDRVAEVVLNQIKLENDDLHLVGWLPYLTDLSLEQSGIDDQGLSHLQALQKLEWLNLWQTRIGNDGLKMIGGLPALQHLPIGGTRITDAGLPHLKRLNELKYLGLRQTAISDQGIEHLDALDSLEALNLSETQVTDGCIPDLSQFRRLKKLWVNDTRISDEGVARLRHALPGCLIFR